MPQNDTLIGSFGRLVFRLRRIADAQLAHQGASLARMKLLMYLSCENAGVRAADIASYFGHSPRTVSEAVEGLERDGLVERVRDPGDGRAKRITLTPAGIAVIASAEPIRAQLDAAIFGALDDTEQAQLRTMLEKLQRAVDELEQRDPDAALPPEADGPVG